MYYIMLEAIIEAESRYILIDFAEMAVMTASKEGLDLRPVKVSTISFVDLAGSERGSVSGYEGSKERIRQSEVELIIAQKSLQSTSYVQHLQNAIKVILISGWRA